MRWDHLQLRASESPSRWAPLCAVPGNRRHTSHESVCIDFSAPRVWRKAHRHRTQHCLVVFNNHCARECNTILSYGKYDNKPGRHITLYKTLDKKGTYAMGVTVRQRRQQKKRPQCDQLTRGLERRPWRNNGRTSCLPGGYLKTKK